MKAMINLTELRIPQTLIDEYLEKLPQSFYLSNENDMHQLFRLVEEFEDVKRSDLSDYTLKFKMSTSFWDSVEATEDEVHIFRSRLNSSASVNGMEHIVNIRLLKSIHKEMSERLNDQTGYGWKASKLQYSIDEDKKELTLTFVRKQHIHPTFIGKSKIKLVDDTKDRLTVIQDATPYKTTWKENSISIPTPNLYNHFSGTFPDFFGILVKVECNIIISSPEYNVSRDIISVEQVDDKTILSINKEILITAYKRLISIPNATAYFLERSDIIFYIDELNRSLVVHIDYKQQ